MENSRRHSNQNPHCGSNLLPFESGFTIFMKARNWNNFYCQQYMLDIISRFLGAGSMDGSFSCGIVVGSDLLKRCCTVSQNIFEGVYIHIKIIPLCFFDVIHPPPSNPKNPYMFANCYDYVYN